MKLTKSQIKQLIKEELQILLKEGVGPRQSFAYGAMKSAGDKIIAKFPDLDYSNISYETITGRPGQGALRLIMTFSIPDHDHADVQEQGVN